MGPLDQVVKDTPQLKLISYDDQEIDFLVFNSNDQQMQALRKYLMEEIPTMAIDRVDVMVNESMKYDESIVLRLGRVPLRSSKADNFVYRRDCDCLDYCSKCSVVIKLEITAPAKDLLVVSNHHLKAEENEHQVEPITFTFKGRDAPYPIVKLYNGQQLEMKCLAQKGQGKTHMKWMPISVATPLPLSADKIRDHNLDPNQRHYQFKVETIGQYTTDELWAKIKDFFPLSA